MNLDLSLPNTTPIITQPVRHLLTALPREGHYLLKLDSTALEGITRCPYFGFNRLVLHREAHARDASLIFGGSLHEGVKHLLLGDSKDLQEQAIVQYFTENFCPVDEYRTTTMALRVMRHYRLRYDVSPEMQFAVIRDGDTPLVEIPFEVPLCGYEVKTDIQLPDWPEPRYIDTIHVAYSGRIDLVASKDDRNMVVDHKTTSVAGDQFIQSFHLSNQAMGYVWVANKLWPTLNISTFCLNAIGLRRCKDDTVNLTKPGIRGGEPPLSFFRSFYEYSDEQLAQWETNTATVISDFIHCVVRDFYPQYTNSCFNKYGRCQYFDACTISNKQVRRRFLLSDNFKPVTWDPTL